MLAEDQEGQHIWFEGMRAKIKHEVREVTERSMIQDLIRGLRETYTFILDKTETL